ncbi:cation:proton antiporter [Salinarimonas soli]|uniref:Sodium:proton antiporter n=1 Tax=Salinarimonas soli TaxID=1638099 RepID=A0A5B2VZF1_9HYPH|nr:sodium:proton antiporter [Salinarimonas soli]KAA2244048.1 sodium:proton antiporter [Salinarimonas soli]
MHAFEVILALLLGATILSSLARRMGVPYPTLLALGGAVLAFVPGAPQIDLPPDLILALFVAPVLLDAAYDASLRDLRANWLPVGSLVLVAVGLTTAAVACAARLIFPDMPWGAAIALGAVVAPPDAVAALAVLRQVRPPYRIRVILEGESLLNDASALLIYRLAVGAVAAGGFSPMGSVPTFAVVVFGSVLAGWLAAWPVSRVTGRVSDAPSSVILQFVFTFGVWLLAERLGLSGVVTIVVFGLTLARRSAMPLPASIRVPSFAIWETVTLVLNVLAFTLIGLQIGPILGAVSPPERLRLVGAALVVLAVVIGIRLLWTFTYEELLRLISKPARGHGSPFAVALPSTGGALVVGWAGMRGIVTIATALALPASFPYRDFIQLSAFVVVLGTLLLQGLTLRPLLSVVRLPREDTVEEEIGMARRSVLGAALAELDGDGTPAAQRLRHEYEDALERVSSGGDPRDSDDNALRRRVVFVGRRTLEDLRSSGVIGDDAYRRVEEELDHVELSALPAAREE